MVNVSTMGGDYQQYAEGTEFYNDTNQVVYLSIKQDNVQLSRSQTLPQENTYTLKALNNQVKPVILRVQKQSYSLTKSDDSSDTD